MTPLPPPQQRSVPVHSWRLAVLCVLVATSLFVGACGSDDDNSTTGSQSAAAPTSTPTPAAKRKPATGSGSTVSLQPKGDQLLFDTNALTAKAGKVTVDFTNDSAIPHNVTLIDSANKTLGETPTFDGGTKSFTATLKAGTYTYYCSVPGHREAGMQGTLTVK
jgi:plastocyanin